MERKEIEKRKLERSIRNAVCRMKRCLLTVPHSDREKRKAFKFWRKWICNLYDAGMIDALDKFLMLVDMNKFEREELRNER